MGLACALDEGLHEVDDDDIVAEVGERGGRPTRATAQVEDAGVAVREVLVDDAAFRGLEAVVCVPRVLLDHVLVPVVRELVHTPIAR